MLSHANKHFKKFNTKGISQCVIGSALRTEGQLQTQIKAPTTEHK